MRTRNDCYYTTAFWDVTERFNVGVEVDYRKTGYMQAPPTEGPPELRLIADNDAMVYWFRTRLTF
jgi:hypothetical protein